MKFILAGFFLLCSITATAQESRLKTPQSNPESSLQLYPVGMELRYERNNEQDFQTNTFWNYAFAYQRANLSALFEYSNYTESSGNSTTSIDHTHQELTLWGRWHFLTTKKELLPLQISIYGGLGVGAYQDEVKTTFMGTSQNDKSGTKVLTGLSLGSDLRYSFTKDVGAIAAIEGRTLFSSDFDPNPTFSAVARLGIFIPLN